MDDFIEELFPFHLMVDASGTITRIGRSLGRVLKGADGRPLLEVVQGIRPALARVEDITTAVGDLVLLQLRGTSLQLRGQFITVASGGWAFVGSPRIVGLESVEAWGLGLQDHAPHDSSADSAMVLETMSAQLKDLEGMVARLQEAERVERSLRERAEAASHAKSNFLANISHEIRTPMTAVLGYAELLRDPTLDPAERTDAAETIVRNANHLMRMLNDLLDLSKIEAGRMDVDLREFSLVKLLRDVRDLMEVAASARGNSLALRLDVHASHDRVIGDPARIRQVLLNLVGNAVKFTSAGAVTIAAATTLEGGRVSVRVDVRDTGKGISPEHLGKLFEPFSQLDREFVREHGGTGLGLAISSRIAALLGGRIEVTSQVGVGSTFTLHTPVDPVRGSAGTPAVDAGGTGARLEGMRVLLVEDCQDSARLLSTMLAKSGATVTVRGDGAAAIAAFDPAQPYAVVLMDLQLPDMNGIDAVRRLRELGCTARIVALTAAALGADRDQAREAGCDAFALKPISRADLVRVCLGEPQQGWGGEGRGAP